MRMNNRKLQSSNRLEHSLINLAEITWPSEKLFRRALLIVTLAWFAFCMLPATQSALLQPDEALSEASFQQSPLQSVAFLLQEQANIGVPMRLKIPRIKVDAAIEPVGLTVDGAMGVPSKLADAAWFDLGPHPGQQGSAVIAGHRSSRIWVPAVFDHLRDLRVGDKIYIEDDQGTKISFVVRESRAYEADEDATDVFSLRDGIHLNLVTCSGDWDKVQKSYNKRLVIFADAIR